MAFSPWLTWGLFVITIVVYLIPLLQAKILGEIVNEIVSTVTTGTTGTGIFLLVAAYAAIWGGTRIVNAFELLTSKIWRTDEIVVYKLSDFAVILRFQSFCERAWNNTVILTYFMYVVQYDLDLR